MAKNDEVNWEDETLDGILKVLRNPRGVACFLCKNLNKDEVTCAAYPEGIDAEIFYGTFAHNKPFGDELKRDGKPILFEK